MRTIRFAMLALLLVSLGLGVWQRHWIWSWWKVRQLAGASDAERGDLAKQVADLGEAALPHVLRALSQPEPACANLRESLDLLTQSSSLQDARGVAVMNAVLGRYGECSAAGKNVALRTLSGLWARTPQDMAIEDSTVERLLNLAEQAEASPVTRPEALVLASALAERTSSPRRLETLQCWAAKGLTAEDSATRMGALQLLLKASFRDEGALLAKVVPLLNDRDAAVRKAALLTLGNAPETIGNEDLLFLLHDHDLEVQMLCERVLRGRGLNDRHIELGRLISDPRPATRCEVVQHLFQNDVDAGTWLRRLSQDTAPSVRAAAARAASLREDADFRSILRDMSKRDPSPTVRELAGHFLAQP